jgi:hypothetical protein
MARSLDFTGKPAFFIRCPVCGTGHVGGDPAEDPATEEFMRTHSKWHENANTPPPPNLVIPR